MPYSQMFKHKVIKKMIGPDAISATALSKQVDVPQSTLSTWLRKAGIDSSHVYPNPSNGNMPILKIRNQLDRQQRKGSSLFSA